MRQYPHGFRFFAAEGRLGNEVCYHPGCVRELCVISGLLNSSLCMLVHVLLHIVSTHCLDTKPQHEIANAWRG